MDFRLKATLEFFFIGQKDGDGLFAKWDFRVILHSARTDGNIHNGLLFTKNEEKSWKTLG